MDAIAMMNDELSAEDQQQCDAFLLAFKDMYRFYCAESGLCYSVTTTADGFGINPTIGPMQEAG